MRKLLLLFVILCPYAQAQTKILELNFEDARAELLKRNLIILSAYYDISVAEAELEQSKLWTNPYIMWNQEMYNSVKNTYFDPGNQYIIQVNQWISVAGKYTNTVKLAKINVETNKLIMRDVLRCVLYDFSIKYDNLYALQEKNILYNEIVTKNENLIHSAEEKLKVGAIPLNEVTRLKSELIALRAESIENKTKALKIMAEVKTLLNTPSDVYLNLTPHQPEVTFLTVEDMIAEALKSRPDLLLKKELVRYNEQNLKLQRSLAMPDMMLGFQPNDSGSNYIRPYAGFAVEMFVPIFNRNQGNIKKAKIQIEQSSTQSQLAEAMVRNEVYQSYETLSNSKKGLETFSDDFLNTLDDLNSHSINNYDKKNINLLEFIDLQRIYIKNKLQYIDLSRDYRNAIDHLNFSVGKHITE